MLTEAIYLLIFNSWQRS